MGDIEVAIPSKKWDLKEHNAQCEKELARLHARLKIVMGDIEVMTTILKMTDCDANKNGAFMQNAADLDVMKCSDACTKKSFIAFNDKVLQDKISNIKSKFAKDLVQDTFGALFDGIKDLQTVEATFLQTGKQPGGPVINVTNFTEPPEQRVKVPGNPCHGAPYPSAATKRAAKCVLSPKNCYILQERFLLIQSGMMDERDQLLESIKELEEYCDRIRTTLVQQIKDAVSEQMAAQTKLAKATEDISEAMGKARTTASENNELDAKLRTEMKACNDKYIGYEGEICALKKIRGELYKIKGGGKVPFFQDCEVSAWEPRECTAECAGGTQAIKRKVLVHEQNGAGCLPLAARRNCNMQPCPVDCMLEAWSEWGKCSAACNEGVQQRLREVKQASMYGGKKCGDTSQTRSCETDSCERDCDLSEWSEWGACSKDCDGRTMKRTKHITVPVEGW